jgi:broad specificity phosphatase PhoE
MSQVVLILPGATDYELQGRIHGDLDIPLCDEGREEVQRVCRELQDLGIEVIYTSCCSSAVQTAETIGKALGVKVKKLENLQNLDHGLWQGLLIDEVKQKQPRVYRQWQEQPESVCPPEGETIEHARQRLETALAKVLKKHKDDVFGLVVPEPLASLVREYLGETELGDLWRATCEHGRWGLIAVEGTSAKPKANGSAAALAPAKVAANGHGANGHAANGHAGNGSKAEAVAARASEN